MDDIALVPVAKAIETLGVGRSKFYELARDGKIELVHIGTKTLAKKASLAAFVASLPPKFGKAAA